MKRWLIIFVLIFLVSCSIDTEVETVSIQIGDQIGIQNDLQGVISGPDAPASSNEESLIEEYKDIGVTSVRNNDYYDDRLDIEGIFNCGGSTYPSWECDPENEENYYWEKSDEQVQSFVEGDLELFLRLGGEWQNQDRAHDFKGPQNKVQEDNWIVAAKKVVERYEGKAEIEYIDIWTEFPSEHFWSRGNKEFFDFWMRVYQEMKEEFPNKKVGGPGFVAGTAVKVMRGEHSLAHDFLDLLYENDIHLDWFGWHYFTNNPEDMYKAVNSYEDLLKGEGDFSDVAWAGTGYFDETEIIVDAYGLSKVDSQEELLLEDELREIYKGEKGAAILAGLWIVMQEGNVERAYYYRGNEANENSFLGGLIYLDGEYLPLAYAFKLSSQFYENYPYLLETDVHPKKDLWVLAAKNQEGERALFVSNTGEEPIKLDIGATEAVVYIIDEGIKEYTTDNIVVEGYSVVLLEISV